MTPETKTPEAKLQRLNRWLIILTVATALLYGGYWFYQAANSKCPCDDGCTCWTPEDDK